MISYNMRDIYVSCVLYIISVAVLTILFIYFYILFLFYFFFFFFSPKNIRELKRFVESYIN